MTVNLFGLTLLISIGFQLIFNCEALGSKTTIIKHTESTDPEKNGFWTRKVSWKSRWVKYWRPKAIYVPVWKKVWGPVVQNEWVPLPNAPYPGWQENGHDMRVEEKMNHEY